MSEPAVAVPRIPYRGIRAFRYLDHAIFFARENETHQLVSLVSVYRGVMLYGDSGAGKSSLVNAGLIPEAIRMGFVPERLRVQSRAGGELVVERVAVSDGEDELLPSVLAVDDDPSTSTVLDIAAFTERIRAACERHRPLLILDQFEEIVTLFDQPGTAEAQRRLVELLAGLLRGALPVKLLFSFREDYLGKLKELLAACPELVDQALRIVSPTATALPTIIRGPYERYPDHFTHELSPALTDQLVAALAERFGTGDVSLSEVQTVCLRLWQSDDPEALLAEKGPKGLLEDYLGEALDEMPGQLRPAAIALLGQMVTSAGTRNVISADDLFQRVQENEIDITPGLLDQALERLSQSRLVRRERRRDVNLYEVTSEFLVPWISGRRDEARRSQDRRRDRRRLLILGSIAAVLLLLSAVVTLLALFAVAQRNDARSEANRATSLALTSDVQANGAGRLDVALVLSLAALAPYGAGPSAPTIARRSMIQALETARLDGLVGILGGDRNPIKSVAFSPDGRTLAAVTQNGKVQMWDLATRKIHGSLRVVGDIQSVAFSPDGRKLAVVTYDNIRLWDLANGEQHVARLTSNSSSVAFSPDGRTLAVGTYDGLRLWHPVTHKLEGVPPGDDSVSSVAFSPDGRALAVGTYDRVQLWNLATKKPQGAPLTANSHVASVAFSADGHMLAAGTDGGKVWLWDPATGKLQGSPLTANGDVYSVVFSPDGRTLATGTVDGTAQLWDLTTRKQEGSPLTAVDSVAFTPDGRMLAAGTYDSTALMWDLGTRNLPDAPLTANGHVDNVAFSPDGHTLAAGASDKVWLLDPATHKLQGSPLAAHTAGVVLRVAFSADGRTLAAYTYGGTVRVWDLATRKPHGSSLTTNGRFIVAVAFSPDGRTLAAGADYGTVQLWDLATRKPHGLSLTANGSVVAFAFSPDGRTLAAGTDYGTVQLWDLATRKPHGSFLTATRGLVAGVAFSPDGRTLAAGTNNGTVQLWDLATRKPHGSLLGAGEIESVAFSPDGRALAAGTYGGKVWLWDPVTREQLVSPLTAKGHVWSVAFSPDGRTLAAGTDDGTVRVWPDLLSSDFAELSNQVCRLVRTGLSSAAWRQYAPDIPYQNPCR